ncbi:MAG TPA: hypothetical protein PK079_17240 [Leptospiraceae bacterium]|nr:hypothetical protein [Leptospiraceae bacterium]HMW05565.1 hypothetical protein [Leptospiraceae bacterium]HMX32876.1 hypothetical protein [Leptospiraceae bacterium]HMY31075.1 hypothetical protein [Leptospiraceae bacterium]HMZ65275.1 hypothetical protein [Leptospiraceae bacterium]
MSDNHNPQGYWTFLVILSLNILFFVYISFIHPGVEPVDKIKASNSVKQEEKK